MIRPRSWRPLLLLVVAAPFLLFSAWSGRAGDRDDRDGGRIQAAVKFLKTIPVPVSAVNGTSHAMYSFDISFVDPATGHYYLADRSNKAVDVPDRNTHTFLTQLFPNTTPPPF